MIDKQNKNKKDKQKSMSSNSKNSSSNPKVVKNEQVVIPTQIEKKDEAPYEEDQTSASGHMPGPEVDDNALDMAQEAGLYPEADEANPKELNIAKQVEKAEQERRNMPKKTDQ